MPELAMLLVGLPLLLTCAATALLIVDVGIFAHKDYLRQQEAIKRRNW